MELQLEPHQLKRLIQEAAELGALIALTRTGRLKPYLKKTEAFRRAGRANIERWIDQGAITIRKDGDHSAAWRIDRIELEALVRSAELLRYL